MGIRDHFLRRVSTKTGSAVAYWSADGLPQKSSTMHDGSNSQIASANAGSPSPFPLMPRIFMAVRREQRYPISEILAQTPAIPASCQWGIFLRNHDELTLEMVTDDERDYMYAEYAKDPRMKANIGIRRR